VPVPVPFRMNRVRGCLGELLGSVRTNANKKFISLISV
jgi:hypothetical protein